MRRRGDQLLLAIPRSPQLTVPDRSLAFGIKLWGERQIRRFKARAEVAHRMVWFMGLMLLTAVRLIWLFLTRQRSAQGNYHHGFPMVLLLQRKPPERG